MKRPWANPVLVLMILVLTAFMSMNLYAEETVEHLVPAEQPDQAAVQNETDTIEQGSVITHEETVEPEVSVETEENTAEADPVMETAGESGDMTDMSEEESPSRTMDLSSEDLDYLKTNISKDLLEQIKEDLKKEIRNDMRLEDENWLDRMHLSVPSWTKKVRLFGDFRFRYEGTFYNEENALILDPSDPSFIQNTHTQRERYRIRTRIGLSAEINKQVDFGLRLATGSSDDPVSTNETLGDYFNKDDIQLDRAYVKILPAAFKPQYAFYLGRFSSPYVGTDLVFDSDLGFEGMAYAWDTRKTTTFGPILVLGAFPLQEENFYDDKWLFGGQLGLEYKPRRDLSLVFTGSYYHYENIEGEYNTNEYPNDNDWTSPLYQQKGNTLINISADSSEEFTPGLASKFRLANITAYMDSAVYYPIHVRFTLDVVENVGFDKRDILNRIEGAGTEIDDLNIEEDTTGYQAELMVGHPKVRNFGEWQWAFVYKYVGRDAVLDAFTDSDFHGGGTNAVGWSLKGEFGIMKNIWLTTRWVTSNEINGPQLNIDLLQVDFNVSF